jgi:hypothetical protein
LKRGVVQYRLCIALLTLNVSHMRSATKSLCMHYCWLLQVRRRAIVPGFHKAWLNAMIDLFTDCNDVLIGKLDEYAKSGEVSLYEIAIPLLNTEV